MSRYSKSESCSNCFAKPLLVCFEPLRAWLDQEAAQLNAFRMTVFAEPVGELCGWHAIS